jgi:two-component system NtrC family response regulator/two-component system response regulator HydG
MNVLIVEDDPTVSKYTYQLMKKWGHETVLAHTGENALKALRANDFDVYLLDIYLPDTTALELIPKIKQWNPDAFIITMTGQNTEALEKNIRRLGICYYMSKPFPTQELKTILDHVQKKEQADPNVAR